MFSCLINFANKIKKINGLDGVQNIPGVFECRLFVSEGDHVEKCINGEQRYGQLITMADDLEGALSVQKKALALLKIDYQEG